MTIAIVGATGFLGSHLVRHLLATTDYDIAAISRAGTIPDGVSESPRLNNVPASVMDESALSTALKGCDVAFYFVHMMGQKNHDFYGQETIAAEKFSAECNAAGVQRVIYMGGLGDDRQQLSEHLLSRHNTGNYLRAHLPLVIEFRASMIVGDGSVAYDIIKNLVTKLPIMGLPNFTATQTQPIALADTLEYLTEAITVPMNHSEIVEIGGRDAVSYESLYRQFAAWIGKKTLIIRVSMIPEWLGGDWLNLFTPRKHSKIGKVMVHSMKNSMVVLHPENAQKYFPNIHPVGLTEAFEQTKSST